MNPLKLNIFPISTNSNPYKTLMKKIILRGSSFRFLYSLIFAILLTAIIANEFDISFLTQENLIVAYAIFVSTPLYNIPAILIMSKYLDGITLNKRYFSNILQSYFLLNFIVSLMCEILLWQIIGHTLLCLSALIFSNGVLLFINTWLNPYTDNCIDWFSVSTMTTRRLNFSFQIRAISIISCMLIFCALYSIVDYNELYILIISSFISTPFIISKSKWSKLVEKKWEKNKYTNLQYIREFANN